MANWGYKADNGPQKWHQDYPVANGCRQSPINIVTSTAESTQFPPLQCKYTQTTGLTVLNTGSSWKVDLPAEGSSLTGGALQGEYKAWQMHAHWGSCAGKGSEHTVDGAEYDAEFHIVHYNTKYGAPGEAADKPDGLAVLGVFIKVGAAHPEFEKLVAALKQVKGKGQTSGIEGSVDPANFLPENKCFYNYEGSLTTPPLLESVIWTVFRDPITFSQEQMEVMRALTFSGESEGDARDCMVDNYRPPCPIGQRKVKVAA